MVKIDNLTKIYTAKAKTSCTALDGISVTLPDTGLVFILGKSGSGKSTLLNLIGGLDSFDGGDIVCFGNSLGSFSEREYEAYRSSFVSFIFQDYHLIDELTVLENITLFSSDDIDEEFLDRTLETVGMKEYVSRYPAELSGGQKQRVAIARGIMKDPRVILCDEPTGNLDRKTSAQILDLLKSLSKDKLVVIVSHNLTEAETYADRIIELADGRIVEDRSLTEGYSDNLEISGGVATIPYHSNMSEDELSLLNRSIGDGSVREININTSGFETTEISYEEHKRELVQRRLGKGNIGRLFKKFFFSKYGAAVATILICMMMFSIFAVIQSFISFDANDALGQSLDNRGSVIAIEKETTSGFPLTIYEDLSGTFDEKTYPLYSRTVWTSNKYGNSWDNINRISVSNNLSDLYVHESYGVLLCDEQYLVDLYGRDGEIVLLAGEVDVDGSGWLITDYFADSLIYHEYAANRFYYLTYESLIGIFVPAGVNSACRISGIIDTDYEEKYEEIFDTYNELKDSDEEIDASDIEDMISSNPLYIDFLDDVQLHLGVAYTLNPDYIDVFSLKESSGVRCNGVYLASGDKEVSGASLNYMSTKDYKYVNWTLSDGEIGIPYTMYNALYGTSYDEKSANKLDTVEPREITIRRYVDNDPKKQTVYEMKCTVTFVTSGKMIAAENVMLDMNRADWYPSRIYIKDAKNIESITEFVTENEYFFVSREQKNLQRINDLLVTFHDLFVVMQTVLIAMIAFYIAYFGLRSIKQNNYQIGVIKALGGTNRDVAKIFVLKTFIIGAISAVISSVACLAFIKFANTVLIASIERVIDMSVNDLQIIRAVPTLILADVAVMMGVVLLSSLLPTILLKRIKPVEIIKAKE